MIRAFLHGLCVAAIAVGLLLSLLAAIGSAHTLPPRRGESRVEHLRRELHHDRTAIRFFRRGQGHIAPFRLRRAEVVWHRRALAWQGRLFRSALDELIESRVGDRSAWGCIHRHEGAWNDPDPPYWGGLQMDYGFQHDYGGDLLRRKGTADHWTPDEQMMVAEVARRSGRGYYPWPRSARICGLI